MEIFKRLARRRWALIRLWVGLRLAWLGSEVGIPMADAAKRDLEAIKKI
jgi:hypothetical protein